MRVCGKVIRGLTLATIMLPIAGLLDYELVCPQVQALKLVNRSGAGRYYVIAVGDAPETDLYCVSFLGGINYPPCKCLTIDVKAISRERNPKKYDFRDAGYNILLKKYQQLFLESFLVSDTHHVYKVSKEGVVLGFLFILGTDRFRRYVSAAFCQAETYVFFVLTRKRNASMSLVERAKKIAEDNINRKIDWTYTNQNRCPYLRKF